MTTDSGPVLLVVRGPIAPQDIPVLCRRARWLLERSGAALVICDVGALVEPDAVTVEALAKVRLTARRVGCRVRLRHPCRELSQLLAFMGLADILH